MPAQSRYWESSVTCLGLLFDFYGLPYITGAAILVAFAIWGFNESGTRATSAALSLCVLPFSFMSISAHWGTHYSRASDAVAHDVTRDVGESAETDTVILAVKMVVDPSWVGLGATLTRQAHVNGAVFPTVLEFECGEAFRRFDTGFANRMVVFQSECGSRGVPQVQFTKRYSWFNWSRGRIVSDSVTVDFFRTE